MKRPALIGWAALLGGLAVVWGLHFGLIPHTDMYLTDIVNRIGMNLLAVIGLALVLGFTGQFSLGHAGFMAVGAYASASLSLHLGLPGQLNILIGDTALRVRDEHECHCAPTNIDVRMMVGPLGELGHPPDGVDPVQEGPEGHRAPKRPIGALPPVELRRSGVHLIIGQHGHAPTVYRPRMSIQVVVAGALMSGSSLLVAQRRRPPELAGLWELPGGKVAPGESEQQALARELHEELGLRVVVGERIGEDVRAAETVLLRAYRVTRVSGDLRAHDHGELRWVDVADLAELPWVPADRAWLPALCAALGG